MKSQIELENLFVVLTTKQRDVMALVADSRTTKEIGHILGVSDSAVNQRINALRAKFGGISRSELARVYRAYIELESSLGEPSSDGEALKTTCQQMTGEKLQLQKPSESEHLLGQDETSAVFSLSDAIEFRIDTPWQKDAEIRIVPRMLDGSNSLLVRGALIAVATLAMLLGMVAVVGVAQGLTAILKG